VILRGGGEIPSRALPARLEVSDLGAGRLVSLRGSWTVEGLRSAGTRAVRGALASAARLGDAAWELRGIESMDLAGAVVIGRAWSAHRPASLEVRDEHRALLARAETAAPSLPPVPRPRWSPRTAARRSARALVEHVRAGLALSGQLVLDLLFLARHPRQIPWREISATTYAAGARALKITALIGLLIGVVVSYLSSLQLRDLGAEVYIVQVLGLSIVRELGPLLTAVLVAGRSGASMTAELGVMRVTQELDALAALGVSRSIRLLVPNALALVIVLPLLTVWTDVAALIGGMLSAKQSLGIGFAQFLAALPWSVPIVNLWIGLLKATVFGGVIALTACHFGLRVEPNTESLGVQTTNSVVGAITQVIVADAAFAIIFQGVGI